MVLILLRNMDLKTMPMKIRDGFDCRLTGISAIEDRKEVSLVGDFNV